MIRAHVTVDYQRELGVVDPMIYGQYLEHVQSEHHCIYGAIVDDPSPLTDERGYRTDVIEAVRELDVPVVRWPGGCFADIYHWEDGIGPVNERPARRNWHWHGVEPNTFGTDEFLHWTERIDAQAYLNLNIGTGILDEAIRWLDYCNGTEPTSEVQTRQRNGRAEPWNVPFWGVGNEQWGPWEANHMDASAYAERVRNWTQFLRKVDPAASFLGIASHSAQDPNWDLTVMLKAGHLIDWLTLHAYGHSIHDGTTDDYYPTVTFPVFFEERLERLIHVVDAAMSTIGRKVQVRISLDEWNIRHLVTNPETGVPTLDRMSPRTLQDAVTAAGVFHAMLRHPAKVGMANYVFLLNGNGILLVKPEGIVKTPLFDLFALYRKLMTGTVVESSVEGTTIEVPVRKEKIGSEELQAVACVDVVTTVRGTTVTHAIVNRHLEESADITFAETRAGSATIHQLAHANPLTHNDFDDPDKIRSTISESIWNGTISIPPHSVMLIERAM